MTTSVLCVCGTMLNYSSLVCLGSCGFKHYTTFLSLACKLIPYSVTNILKIS